MAEKLPFSAISERALSSATPLAIFLHRRTRLAAVRTVHATIAGPGFEQGVAVRAFVEPLACIGRHGLQFLVSAVRAGEQGFQNGFERGHGRVGLAVISCSILPRISSTEISI